MVLSVGRGPKLLARNGELGFHTPYKPITVKRGCGRSKGHLGDSYCSIQSNVLFQRLLYSVHETRGDLNLQPRVIGQRYTEHSMQHVSPERAH